MEDVVKNSALDISAEETRAVLSGQKETEGRPNCSL